MSFDLAQGWLAGLKKELEPLGVKIVVRDPNWNTNAGAQAVTTLISRKARRDGDPQPRRADLRQAAAEGREPKASTWCRSTCARAYPSVGLSSAPTGSRSARRTPTAVVDACKGKSNKIAIVQGALVGRGQRLHAQGRRERAGQASRYQGGLQPGRRLGCGQGQGHHADGAEAAPRSVRHRRLLGRHGHRHRGGDQGSRADRQGVPRHLGRRRAEGRLRPGEERRLRPRPQLRRADAGRATWRR